MFAEVENMSCFKSRKSLFDRVVSCPWPTCYGSAPHSCDSRVMICALSSCNLSKITSGSFPDVSDVSHLTDVIAKTGKTRRLQAMFACGLRASTCIFDLHVVYAYPICMLAVHSQHAHSSMRIGSKCSSCSSRMQIRYAPPI